MQAQSTLARDGAPVPTPNGCPQCFSPDTQSFQMAYMSGTTSGSIVASSYNFNGGGATLTGGRVKQQSQLAALVQPPVAPFQVSAVLVLVPVLIMGSIIIGGMLWMFGYTSFWLLLMLAGTAVAGYHVNKSDKADNERARLVHADQLRRWQHSWICLRCGHRWFRR